VKLKKRDEALQKFKHYYEKLDAIKKERQTKMKGANTDPSKEQKEAEILQRVNYLF